MFYVYVLKSLKDSTTYIGFTEDLDRRISQHNAGKTKSIKGKRPFELVYFEAYQTKKLARKRELKLKNSSFEKEKLFNRIFDSE
jgi:putative endonuclease